MLSGIGGHLPEIIIVLVVILIIWGPGKLPDVGAAMGKGIREFRKASSDAHDTVVGTSTTPTAQAAQPAQPAPVAQVTAPLGAPVQGEAVPHQPTVSG
ncbi:MAG TPA: twin-arginine translocase TatA/TatE family subunit [Candidatus Saccharimonadales bacterium]|nr:twin-arginine translocase TatA/TatE family subunit [Candidatus Saccharimonadales bacterium]